MSNTYVAALAFLATALVLVESAGAASVGYERASRQVRLTNGRIELLIDTRSGLNPNSLRDTKSGRVFADASYVWDGGDPPVLAGEPVLKKSRQGASVTLTAARGPLQIEQSFTAPARDPNVIIERITIRNTGSATLDTSGFACGFAKNTGASARNTAGTRFCNVPYRVQTDTGELCDYSVSELFRKQCKYPISRILIYQESPIYGAEGWAWYGGGSTLLVSKYNPDALEWSLLAPIKDESGKAKQLRFGGAGIWKLGDPEGAASLPPGGSFTFGETRYQALDGDWKQAYYEYRKYTQSKGHRLAKSYNPPVHWNELYDNRLWWGPGLDWPPPPNDTAETRKTLYGLSNMAEEAEKAKEIGCECFYLDPGWDTVFASTIWGADRLGEQRDFIKWMKENYGLKYLALHTPLAPWTDVSTYPAEAVATDAQGKRLHYLCCTSKQYSDVKIARLKKLCEDGAYFLMYDGSFFENCWDPNHGHSVPLKRQEHLDAILRIQQEVKKDHPNVLIEQHDPIIGPGMPRYTPTYFMHSKPGAFDELWGYEFMIETLRDITSRKAMSLYYVNLAYTIPVYLHIDLRRDNANALGFWWYASTCRHLGFGGKSPDTAIWEAQKKAMKAYMAQKLFFTRGTFYGLDETVHAHTLTSKRACVMNCFNLTDKPETREITFKLSDIGLPSGRVRVSGADCTTDGDNVTLRVSIPAMGHTLVKLRV